MSKITKIMHVEKMTLPKPHLFFSVSDLIYEYYIVYYLSGQMRAYDEFTDLPKRAKQVIKYSFKHYTETKDENFLYKHTIFRV